MVITSVFYDTDESKSQHHAADKITQSMTLKTNISTKNAHQTLSPIFSLLFSMTLKKILKQPKNILKPIWKCHTKSQGYCMTIHRAFVIRFYS